MSVLCSVRAREQTADSLLVYVFEENLDMSVTRYGVGRSGNLQARDWLAPSHQPGGYPLVPEVFLPPSACYVPEFARGAVTVPKGESPAWCCAA